MPALPARKANVSKPLPSMIRGMTFFHRYENSGARCADFSTSGKVFLHGCAIICQIDNLRGRNTESFVRCWPAQLIAYSAVTVHGGVILVCIRS